MRLYFIFLCAILTTTLSGQFTDDTERLKKMSYMKYSTNIDCDNTTGSNIESRICLNLEFQEIDATLNIRFKELLETIEQKRLKKKYIRYQKRWIKHRRLQSKTASSDYDGHMSGIRYLATMIVLTQNRIKSILKDFLLFG